MVLVKAREKIRNLTLLQYSLITLILSVIFVLVSGFVLTKISFNHLIRVHVDLYPTLARIIIQNNPGIEEYLSKPAESSETPPDFGYVFTPLIRSSPIFRLKLWNNDLTLVWSDERELIGKNFPDNEDLAEALTGSMVYSLEEADAAENETEAGEGTVLECYIPLFDGNRVIGAFELYERSADLARLVRVNRMAIWFGAAGFFCVLYLTFFLIFYNSNSFNIRMIRNLTETQDVMIYALAYQAEMRDSATGKHIQRTTMYVRHLAEGLRAFPGYRQYISPEYLKALSRSAPLHDIGKVGIPDSILLKPGPLTREEFELIKTHTVLGAETLRKAQEQVESRSFLDIAIQLALSHHEKWDGSGYPCGLVGEQIPLSGRIMAVADVYDALSTARSYKPAFSHEESARIIREGSGTHFDPQIVEAFLLVEHKFNKTGRAFRDA